MIAAAYVNADVELNEQRVRVRMQGVPAAGSAAIASVLDAAGQPTSATATQEWSAGTNAGQVLCHWSARVDYSGRMPSPKGTRALAPVGPPFAERSSRHVRVAGVGVKR